MLIYEECNKEVLTKYPGYPEGMFDGIKVFWGGIPFDMGLTQWID